MTTDTTQGNSPPETLRLVTVTAGTSDPSSTKLLTDRVVRQVDTVAEEQGIAVTVRQIDLRELATEISTALLSRLVGPKLQRAVDALGEADGIVVGTPVYKAGASGLFTSFFQVLDDDLLIAKPVVLTATAGTARHALVVDEQLRSLFAYLRALTAPTSLFAATEDWGDPALTERVDRAAVELLLLMRGGFTRGVRDQSWRSYRHEFGSDGGNEVGIDLNSDLMRLATGGSAA